MYRRVAPRVARRPPTGPLDVDAAVTYPCTRPLDALDGWGLGIVDMLAARCGVDENPAGKTVWIEVQAA